jgi:cation diffusion facilitator CzcD-associated flavoprotein CzcO
MIDEVECHEAIVVGGGAAGLGVAAELKRRRVPVLLLERSGDVGASWRKRYRGLELNNDRWTARLPRAPIPRRAGRWPVRDAYISYLERYAVRHGLDIRFGVDVRRIDRDPRGWLLWTDERPLLARYAVVCTGRDRLADIPPWPGRKGFQGKLLHAADYQDPGQFEGQDVLIVGFGTSATEIAVRLVERAERVRVAVRGFPNLMPANFLGVPMPVWARLVQSGPAWVADGLGRVVQGLSLRGLRELGLERPPHGVATEMRVKGMGPVIDRGFLSAMRTGGVELVGAVEAFQGSEVLLADGTHITPDVVIAATGYRPGLEELVGHLAVLKPSGQPQKPGAEADARAPGLFFSGYRLPLSGELSSMRVDSRRISTLIAKQGAIRR